MKKYPAEKRRITANIIIPIVVLGAWIYMLTNQEGSFASRGIGSLKWFTVLSNLLEGAACLVWLCLRKRQRRFAELLKYVAAVSVALTFTTVILFLGPIFGYGGMFRGANLWFHLLVPIAAMLEFILGCSEEMDAKANRLAVLPMLAYSIFYLGNIIIHGKGTWPHTNDWYGFLTWGLPAGILIFAVLICLTYLLGWLLRRCGRFFRGQHQS